MEILQRLDEVISLVVKRLETNTSAPTLVSFHRLLIQIKGELSKPEISTEFLRQASGGLSRIIQETIWSDTPLGDEILNFLGELREYRKESAEG